MSRAFDLDVLRCSQCAGRMELIAIIDDPAVVYRMLAHLGCRAHATLRCSRSLCLNRERLPS